MIGWVIISGLIFFDCGTHPTHAVGHTSSPQLGNSQHPLVATSINHPFKNQVPLPASEQSSEGHRLRKRAAARMINKENNNTISYALRPVRVDGGHADETLNGGRRLVWDGQSKPVRVDGGHADETLNGGRRLVWDGQSLMPKHYGREGRKRQVLYDQFTNAFSELIESKDSRNHRPNSLLSVTILGNDDLTVEFSSEDGNEYLNSDTQRPSSSQSLPSFLPSDNISSEGRPSKAASKGRDFPNKDRYRVSSFIGTFGIAGDVPDREYSPKMDDHLTGTVNNSDANLKNGDRIRSMRMQHQSNSHDENTHTERHADTDSDNHIKQNINSSIAEKKNMVNDHDYVLEIPDKKSQTNSNSRSSREDVRDGSINLWDERTASVPEDVRDGIINLWDERTASVPEDVRDGSINLRDERTLLGKSLQHSGYIKVYKTNGSHILGVRKIRPSKRARNLMFGKTKKIKPFPFSSAFRNKIISFPIKMITGENNETEISKLYDDNNLDEVVYKSFQRDQEQNEKKFWGSTAPMSDHLSFYDDDYTKTPTLAPPIYKKGPEEIKFAPTDDDLVRAGTLVLKEDKNKIYEDPDNEHKLDYNNSSHNELQLAEENYIKVANDDSDLEKEQDDMSIFIESKHEMTYVLPPKPLAKTYRENSFLPKDNISLFKDSSSLDIGRDFSSKTKRKPSFTPQPHWLQEQPIVRDSIRSSPSTSVYRSLDRPVTLPQSWHQHPSVRTASLPLRNWVLLSASVPPTRWSSLVKEESNRHPDDAGSKYHKAYYVEPVFRSIAIPSTSSRDSDPTFRNWEEVANAFGDHLTSHFKDEKLWLGNSYSQKHSPWKQYISQPSSYSTVYPNFRNFKINSAPPLYRQDYASPLALSINDKDVNKIPGESGLGSEDREIFSVLAPTTTKATTTKKKTPYGRKFRRSGILNSYYSDATSDSENPEGGSSDRTDYQDYPRYSKVPRTSFSCEGRHKGYYADPRAQCQVFHLCQRSGQKASFLCPNGTLFSQRLLTCDHWQAVDCERAEQHYLVNKDLYRERSTTTTKSSLFMKKNKIRFQDEETKNFIGHSEESQSAGTHRLRPNPSLVTRDSRLDSSSSSSLIPRYPGLEDLLRPRGPPPASRTSSEGKKGPKNPTGD